MKVQASKVNQRPVKVGQLIRVCLDNGVLAWGVIKRVNPRLGTFQLTALQSETIHVRTGYHTRDGVDTVYPLGSVYVPEEPERTHTASGMPIPQLDADLPMYVVGKRQNASSAPYTLLIARASGMVEYVLNRSDYGITWEHAGDAVLGN